MSGHWNYRIFKVERPDGTLYELREAYYDEAGNLVRWSARAVGIASESVDGFAWIADRLKEAAGKPILAETGEKIADVRNPPDGGL